MAHDTGTRYLCLGHPAWPGNLDVSAPEEAQAWLDEHKGTHPGVHVDVVQTVRTPFTGVAPEPLRPVDEVRREHLDSVIEVLTSTLRFVEEYGHIKPQAVPGWRMAIDNLKTVREDREVVREVVPAPSAGRPLSRKMIDLCGSIRSRFSPDDTRGIYDALVRAGVQHLQFTGQSSLYDLIEEMDKTTELEMASQIIVAGWGFPDDE